MGEYDRNAQDEPPCYYVLKANKRVMELSPREFAIVVAYINVMLGVCFLACVVPTRRASPQRGADGRAPAGLASTSAWHG